MAAIVILDLDDGSGGGSTINVASASVAFTGYAPTVRTATTVSPGAGALLFTGNAPSLTNGSRISVAAASVAFARYSLLLLLALLVG